MLATKIPGPKDNFITEPQWNGLTLDFYVTKAILKKR